MADSSVSADSGGVFLAGGGGRQVADAARLSRPELKILFITGYAENAVIGNGRLDPGMQVINKPFPMTMLAVRVRAIIENQSSRWWQHHGAKNVKSADRVKLPTRTGVRDS